MMTAYTVGAGVQAGKKEGMVVQTLSLIHI